MEMGATLADDDLAGLDDLAAEPLDAESLGVGSRPLRVSWKRPSCVPCLVRSLVYLMPVTLSTVSC